MKNFLVLLLILLAGVSLQDSDGADFEGADSREISFKQYGKTLELIQHRVSSSEIIEPLLLFSPYGDPDILGSIATNSGLPVAVREVAANAILDQLYLANPYFQMCSSVYIHALSESSKPSLRLKGYVGKAILEYIIFYGKINNVSSARILSLQMATTSEFDPQLRQVLAELTRTDPSSLVQGPAWSWQEVIKTPYRRLDKVSYANLHEVDVSQSPAAVAWNDLSESKALSAALLQNQQQKLTYQQFASQIKQSENLAGILSRISATMPSLSDKVPIDQQIVKELKRITTSNKDPYIRSLSLAPVCYEDSIDARDFYIAVLSNDISALVRLSAADALKQFTSDGETRQRLTSIYRREEDWRVRLFILHALVYPFSSNPAPDVQAFLLNVINSENKPEVLEFAAYILGNARVRTSGNALLRLIARSEQPTLRARIAEALNKLGYGRMLRDLAK